MSASFRAATQACAALRVHLKSGLQALRASDRRRLRARDSRRLAGSIDVDSALASALPNAPRWDYGVGYRPSNRASDVVHWVEVHPATQREVKAIEAKLEWLKKWIDVNATDLAALDRCFVWVSSGKTHLTPTSPALRRLAQKGCRHVGQVYEIQ